MRKLGLDIKDTVSIYSLDGLQTFGRDSEELKAILSDPENGFVVLGIENIYDLELQLGITIKIVGDLSLLYKERQIPDSEVSQFYLTDLRPLAQAIYLDEEKMLSKNPKMYKFDVQTQNSYLNMQRRGFRFDYEKFQILKDEHRKIYEEHLQLAREMAGLPNLRCNCTADLVTAIYHVRGLEPLEGALSHSGKPSFRAEVLEKLVSVYNDDFVKLIIKLKSELSVLSTLNNLDSSLYKTDEGYEMHSTFRTLSDTAASRVYCTHPSATSLPDVVRSCMIPQDKNNQFLYFDIHQAEFILFAHLADETWLTDLYLQGEDIHRHIVSKLNNCPLEDVSAADREISKVVIFSALFGSEGGAAASALKIPYSDGVRLMNKFWRLCPKINNLKNKLISYSEKTKLTRTPSGRVCVLKGKTSREISSDRGRALNFPIQSGLADLTKEFINRAAPVASKYFNSNFIMTVFDSFLVEVPKSVDKVAFEKTMSDLLSFRLCKRDLRFSVDFSYGDSFQDAKC